MSLRVAIQMDPIEGIHLASDSTFVLALAALERGHEVFSYQPASLASGPAGLFAMARPVLSLRREEGNHVDQGPITSLNLASCDVVLIRQDPPFDMAYVTTTHFLETLPPHTLVVNDPAGIRNSPEKILVLSFRDLMPPTLVTADRQAVEEFREQHGEIVLKPVYGHGGNGVFLVSREDPNFSPLFDLLVQREPIIVQRYLPEILDEGDRRVILIDGEPIGCIDRLPLEGDIRSNLVAGGAAKKGTLSDRDREICMRIGPELRRRGLVLAGIDVIAGMLTEINVTSPTGLPSIERFDGISVGEIFWDCVEARAVERSAD